MSLKNSYYLTYGLILVGAILALNGVMVGVLLLIAVCILDVVTFHCPHCGSYLDRISPLWGDGFCPKCGEAIDWGEKRNGRK